MKLLRFLIFIALITCDGAARNNKQIDSGREHHEDRKQRNCRALGPALLILRLVPGQEH